MVSECSVDTQYCSPQSGVRFNGPNGETEFIEFPEGAEREAFLNSLPPEYQSEVEQTILSGRVYDVYLSPTATMEDGSAGMTIQIGDGANFSSYSLPAVSGYQLQARRPSFPNDRRALCAMGFAGGITLVAGGAAMPLLSLTKRYGDDVAKLAIVGGSAAVGGVVVLFATAYLCKFPSPPPTGGGGGSGSSGSRGVGRPIIGEYMQMLDPAIITVLGMAFLVKVARTLWGGINSGLTVATGSVSNFVPIFGILPVIETAIDAEVSRYSGLR